MSIELELALFAVLCFVCAIGILFYGLGTANEFDLYTLPSVTTKERNMIEVPETGIGDLSDGYHTFNQLYYQRMMLFAVIVKQNRESAWKSLRHEDGELCFGGGWFIVGIDTPEGSYTYHYEDKFYSLFDCEELGRGKHWDGHTEKDVTRLLSLPKERTGRWMPTNLKERPSQPDSECSECGYVTDYFGLTDFCPNCGAHMIEVGQDGRAEVNT